MALPDSLPPASGNRYGDDPAAAELGFRVFYDPRFSSLDEVRCATCHLPERSFQDGLAVSEVITGRPLARNSPSILTAAWMGPFYFWDGRADSLWSQPLFAFEASDEMGGSRLGIAHAIADNDPLLARYEAAFGSMPDLSDTVRFPETGKPGDASFDEMAPRDQLEINQVFANVGKSLEAYMRKVATGRSPLDEYIAGDVEALMPAARSGLALLVTKGCTDCHSGPTLSDEKFHHVDITPKSEPGRANAVATLLDNPFNSRGPFYDKDVGHAPELPAAPASLDEGAVRTPTLRDVGLTSPYGSAGQYATLGDLLAVHGGPLTAQEINDISVLLLSLEGAYPQRPWSDWPAR